ncbi:hypothetical protein F4802DRAFT_272317 [Xylaria palmicola]|nr:hypothetical protein F4802DRAFT_272317 [Xylaria palmicola]
MRVHGGGAFWSGHDVAALCNTSDHEGVRLGLFSAFKPWELQQINHVDCFVRWQCEALHPSWEWATHGITLDEPGKVFFYAESLVRYIREKSTDFTDNLADTRLLAPPSGEMFMSNVPYSLGCLTTSVQTWRSQGFPDPVRDRPVHPQQQGDGSNNTIEFVGDAVDRPPFGWIDATDGLNVYLFGDALVRPGSYVDDYEVYDLRIEQAANGLRYRWVEFWERAGFTFWDKSRVEALKKSGKLKIFQTGWVVRRRC